MAEETQKERTFRRWEALKAQRSAYLTHCQEVVRVLMPRSGRFFVQDRDTRRDSPDILDNHGTLACDSLAAGLQAGANSPAREWFRLGVGDPDLAKFHRVRVWLNDVAERMHKVFSRANTYRAIHYGYEELGPFGTHAQMVRPDADTVIHHYPFTAGEYALAQNQKEVVDTIYREFEMTVEQVVEEFGLDACSQTVRNLWDRGSYDSGVAILHVIEPRRKAERDYRSRSARHMPWRSCYYEMGSDRERSSLREGGFLRFPVLAPRWGPRPGDVYSYGCGNKALGDIRQLQQQQYRKAEAIEKQVDPPMQVPTALDGTEVETMPGGQTPYDQMTAGGGIRPLADYRLQLDHMLLDLQDVRQRIDRAFFVDLFRMLSLSSARQDPRKTATEVAELHEEKLIMIGPVLGRLHNEVHAPLIDMTFQAMLEAGQLPPIPPELQGQQLVPQFVSVLDQAQQLVEAGSTDRFLGTLKAIGETRPEVFDRIDPDYLVDKYAEMFGVDPKMLVPVEKAKKLREARNRAEQAAAEAAALQQQAATAKDLAAASTDEPNALTQFMGYSYPGV